MRYFGSSILLYHGKEKIHSEIRDNYLLTEVVQSNKYYKFRAVDVTSKVGRTTDQDLSVLAVLKKHISYSSEIPGIT